MKGYSDRELAELVHQGKRSVRIKGTEGGFYTLSDDEKRYLLDLARRERGEETETFGPKPRMSLDERSVTTRLSDDGKHLIITERWLDRQVMPPRWRSKNRRRKLSAKEIEYYRQRSAVSKAFADTAQTRQFSGLG